MPEPDPSGEIDRRFSDPEAHPKRLERASAIHGVKPLYVREIGPPLR